MDKLVSIAKDLLIINEDFEWRIRDKNCQPVDLSHYELHAFEQLWPDTTCGFGGIGGQAFTTCTVYAILPKDDIVDNNIDAMAKPWAVIYIGSRFAYTVPKTAELIQDIQAHRIRPVSEKSVYMPKTNEVAT